METNSNMMMSESINEIATALCAFQSEVEQPKLEKEVKVTTKQGRQYSFKYADLSACVKAAIPGLKANGLAVAQVVNNGMLTTLLTHKSGQWLKSEVPLPQQIIDYQSYGSAITYLKRYSYCAILGIVADTDDDANMACGNTAEFKNRQSEEDNVAKAMSDIQGAKNRTELQEAWKKWNRVLPELFKPNAILYNEFAIKGQELNGKAS